MMETAWEFQGSDRLVVYIDNDGQAVYAFLLDENRRPLADVWLFNVGATPESEPWKGGGDRPPFKDSANNMRTVQLVPKSLAEFTVSWLESAEGARVEPMWKGSLRHP